MHVILQFIKQFATLSWNMLHSTSHDKIKTIWTRVRLSHNLMSQFHTDITTFSTWSLFLSVDRGYSMVWHWMWNLFHEGDRIFHIFISAKHEWKYLKSPISLNTLCEIILTFNVKSLSFLFITFSLVFENVSFKS